MKKKVFVWLAAGVVIVAAGAGIVTRIINNRPELVVEKPPVVVTEQPENRTIKLENELIGKIEPDNIVYIMPKGSGEVMSVNVKTGDYVEAGQLLCVIDTKQVESARINMETARISMETANTDLARDQVLYASGDISRQAFQESQDNANLRRLQYENAQIAYNTQLESSNVTTPIAGKIESYNVEVHDMISPQTQVCVVSGEGSKAVTFYVTERIVVGINIDDEIKIEKNGSEYSAVVTEVSSMIDESTGLFKIKAAVETGDALPTGSSVKLYVTSEKAENVMTIPVDAVYYEGGDAFVYTYVEGKVQKNAVSEGLFDSEYIEISEGLNEDSQVIVSWSSELYEGSEVVLETYENIEADGSETEEPEAQAQ